MPKNTEKDRTAAANLRKQGVERKTMRCAACNKMVPIGPGHAQTCKGY